ncbi:MAG: carbonic anhydrase family protein [Steroidobacteraceae bacterium]|jgi:carbonic anhydrase
MLLPATQLQGQDSGAAHYVSPWRTPWDYSAGPRGPAHWGALDPDYALCNSGREQSPVNITTTRKSDLPALHFEYHSAPLKFMTNNGAAIRVDFKDPPGSGDFLVVDGKRYELQQFHFHRPSEEYVHGHPSDMVLHLMHRAADGQIAGVAVLLRRGHANAMVQQLIAHMPRHAGLQAVRDVELDPGSLLPVQLGYYEYQGSQTAPPCTEGVRWFVLKTPLEVGAAQIRAFAAIYPHDVRPLQPLNGRSVLESR